MVKSKNNTLPYSWGEHCMAWQLVNTKELSVIQEVIPPQAKEQLHFYTKIQQFFFL